ncbi:MAG: hypothetical protein LUC43_08895 [Burkholderiales bacterium]|nr:hypothetical protein [Burkholderiales bacterium]
MENGTNYKKNYFFSPKTKEEFSALLKDIQEDESLDDSMNALDANIDAFLVPKTGELVGEATKTGRIEPGAGAQLSYSDYSYYFSHEKRKKSIGDKLWGLAYPDDLNSYRLISTLIAWQFTQTVLMKIPSFNLSRDLHGEAIESIPFEFFFTFQGLPLYMPIKSRKYVGVMLNTNPRLPLAGMPEDLKFYGELEKDGIPLVRNYALQFLLFGKEYDNVISLWFDNSERYWTVKEMEDDRAKGKIPLSFIKERFAKDSRDRQANKICLDILMGALFLSKNLPFPSWVEESKTIHMEINPKNGKLTAKLPEMPNMIVLTPEGCVDLSDPDSEVTTVENEDRILH